MREGGGRRGVCVIWGAILFFSVCVCGGGAIKANIISGVYGENFV